MTGRNQRVRRLYAEGSSAILERLFIVYMRVGDRNGMNQIKSSRVYSNLIISHRFRDLGSIVNRHSCVKSSK